VESTRRPNQPDPFKGRVLPGGLRVLERLRETSEGPLHRAEYSPPGAPVAVVFLKFLQHPEGPSRAWAAPPRRLAWVHRAGRIRHPNVAGVHEVCETPEGIAYAVVEALTGDRLVEILAARGALPLHEAVDLCLQAAAGLSAAHEAGIAHGNISPSTILLTHAAGGRRLVKLIGFTPTSLAASSSGYASPERLDGHPPDESSDVFGLGAVLYHLLVGRPPGGRSVPRSVPKAVRTVLGRALAVSPDRRFQTIVQFADALSQALTMRNRAKLNWPRRTIVVGATVASLAAAGLWLAWGRQQVAASAAQEGWETGTTPPARAVPARSRSAASVAPRSEPRPPPPPPRKPDPAPPSASPPRKPDAARPGSAPAARRLEASPAPSTTPRTAPTPRPALSPFRQAHPWAAVPGGRFYFRSDCSLALRSSDLVYFRSEEEARASGRLRSPVPDCS
jgi:serine/threonine-protein kinase